MEKKLLTLILLSGMVTRQYSLQKVHGNNKFRLLEVMESKALQNNINNRLMFLYSYQLLREQFLLITQGRIHKSSDLKSINLQSMMLSSKVKSKIQIMQSIIKNFQDLLIYLKHTRSQSLLQRTISMV